MYQAAPRAAAHCTRKPLGLSGPSQEACPVFHPAWTRP